MTKVLLCGGAGYIGSHTAVELLAVQAYHLLEVAQLQYQKGAETDAHHDGYNPNGPFFHLIAKVTTPFLATKC